MKDDTTQTADRGHSRYDDAMLQDVVCPFCALLCDDLSLPVHSDRPQAETLACPKARAGFELALAHTTAQPRINGEPCTWPAATERARALLSAAQLPLFDGLQGDLQDCRAAWQLAARYGGVVDHRDGDATARNLAVYQDSGWLTTSLGEARNRADLMVVLGGGDEAALPRLREKLFEPGQRLHRDTGCDVVRLVDQPLRAINQARVLLGQRPLDEPDPQALKLHGRLAESVYAVFVISLPNGSDNDRVDRPSGDSPEDNLPDDLRAELLLRAVSDLVRDINQERRAALLFLSSGIGDVTAQISGGWHNGFGIRTGFARGYPEQDLLQHTGHRLLAGGGADLHVWLGTLSPQPPPSVEQPQIVIGHPAMQFDGKAPEVYMPAAIPGVHREGFLHRADGLRMLPLAALVTCDLPNTLTLCEQLLPADAQRGAI